MIGMVNIPSDSPMEFYATPFHKESLRSRTTSDSKVPRTPTSKRPSYRHIFSGGRKKTLIQYTDEGRKVSDGVIETTEPNKLWEELLLRSFAHRMEDEIQSPLVEDQYKTLDQELQQLNVKVADKSAYSSTYSLVSNNRAEETSFDDLKRIKDGSLRRSVSTESLPHCLFHNLPFIKSIKGKKKKTEV